jgi:hypothetical protein
MAKKKGHGRTEAMLILELGVRLCLASEIKSIIYTEQGSELLSYERIWQARVEYVFWSNWFDRGVERAHSFIVRLKNGLATIKYPPLPEHVGQAVIKTLMKTGFSVSEAQYQFSTAIDESDDDEYQWGRLEKQYVWHIYPITIEKG